jgi:TatD DNase family protein
MLLDSHCHLDAGEFDGDREAVLARAAAAGVRGIVVPATHADGWPKLRAVCAGRDDLHAAYGLHPMFLDRHRPEHIEALREWLHREQAVAIGECGLDYFVDGLDRDVQQRCFDAQLRLARDFELPVIVHARRAVDAVSASLRRVGGLRGVVHSFSGSEQQARQLWDLGFLVGLGGPVTHERATRLRRLAATMPLEFLLLETDAPDQPDAGIRGQRNEPARLASICAAIARLRDEDPQAIAACTADNARRLFGLPH